MNTYVEENFVPCLTTFSTASRKSRSVATFLRARIANMPACVRLIRLDSQGILYQARHTSVATDRSSAPVVLGHNRAIRSKRISRSTLILLLTINCSSPREREGTNLRAWIRRMCARPSLSGRENSTRRSRRPGRSRAGSRVSGLTENSVTDR